MLFIVDTNDALTSMGEVEPRSEINVSWSEMRGDQDQPRRDGGRIRKERSGVGLSLSLSSLCSADDRSLVEYRLQSTLAYYVEENPVLRMNGFGPGYAPS